MPTVQENEQKFEEMGLGSVKTLIRTSGLPQHMMTDAIRWAARREDEERLASKTNKRSSRGSRADLRESKPSLRWSKSRSPAARSR